MPTWLAAAVVALVRPFLTWCCVTLPGWLEGGDPRAPIAVMSLDWRRRHLYEDGKSGDRW